MQCAIDCKKSWTYHGTARINMQSYIQLINNALQNELIEYENICVTWSNGIKLMCDKM